MHCIPNQSLPESTQVAKISFHQKLNRLLGYRKEKNKERPDVLGGPSNVSPHEKHSVSGEVIRFQC
jgi:hypothetical protein